MQSITGTWQLIHTECIGTDGSALAAPYGGDSAFGLLSMRADGRLICVLYNSSAELPSDEPREYNSYCGAFTFDGKKLITRVDASANPDWIGTDQIRDVHFDAEIMVLRPVKGSGPVTKGQRVLRWVRLPDAVGS